MKQEDLPTIQSRGGYARAEHLSRKRRADIARKAAQARWAKSGASPLAAHYGAPDRPLRIGPIEIPCYVLSDKTRVLAQRGLQSGVGMSEGGGKRGARKIAELMASLAAKGIDVNGLVARANSPIRFIPPHGGNPADGYEATILPDICAVLIDAAQKLDRPGSRLKKLAERAAVLQHGFATVGIIALVDEATGYQQVREREALQTILDAYIGRELAKWAKRFPDQYYLQMSRLKGLDYNPNSSKRPMILAVVTIDMVYDRIGPGLTKELRYRRQEVFEATGKRGELQQLLTEDVGHPALQHHLSGITFAAKGFKDGDWDGFRHFMDRVSPPYNRPLLLPFPENEDVNAELQL
jgi:hypothetical protein